MLSIKICNCVICRVSIKIYKSFEKNVHVALPVTSSLGMESNILMKVGVPYLEPEICEYSLRGRRVLPGQLCAGGMPGMNACRGDSGGPLIASTFNSDGKQICYQVGIVSIGFGSCLFSTPSIYTNVEDFMPWILDNIRD